MIAVLGAGMAGVGALTRLKREGIDDAVVYDMKSHIGGHTASYEYDSGFTFDEGPHISFTTDELTMRVQLPVRALSVNR